MLEIARCTHILDTLLDILGQSSRQFKIVNDAANRFRIQAMLLALEPSLISDNHKEAASAMTIVSAIARQLEKRLHLIIEKLNSALVDLKLHRDVCIQFSEINYQASKDVRLSAPIIAKKRFIAAALQTEMAKRISYIIIGVNPLLMRMAQWENIVEELDSTVSESAPRELKRKRVDTDSLSSGKISGGSFNGSESILVDSVSPEILFLDESFIELYPHSTQTETERSYPLEK